MSQVRPLNDWVLVRLTALPQKEGGVVLLHPPLVSQGQVVRVGPGRHYTDGEFRPTQLKAEEVVAFLSVAVDNKQGRQVSHEVLGPSHVLIRETDVLFVIEEGALQLDK